MIPGYEDELSPRILTAFGFDGQAFTGRLRNRTVADEEFEFVTEGGGRQTINGVDFPMLMGDLVWRRPGATTQGHLPYSCLTLVLDLRGQRRTAGGPYNMDLPKPLQDLVDLPVLSRLPPVITLAEPAEMRRVFQSAVRTFANPGPGSALRLRSLALELLARLHDEALYPSPESTLRESALRFRPLTRFLRTKFTRKLSLDDLAREAGLSPTYLHAAFRNALGVTPLEYLTRVRLAHARELLASTSLPVVEVAKRCGWDNPPYFFTLFKRRTGTTPQEFRLQHRPSLS